MGLFEISQETKKQIEHSPDLMGQLKRYAAYDPDTCPLTLINRGRRHAYFSLGRLESGLWVATRELKQWYDHGSHLLQAYCENYGLNLESVINRGDLTPEFCIGVKVKTNADSHEDGDDIRYFLLVQDLTQGGKEIPESEDGREFSFFGSRKIHHDFDNRYDQTLGSDRNPFRFMNTNGAMIDLGMIEPK